MNRAKGLDIGLRVALSATLMAVIVISSAHATELDVRPPAITLDQPELSQQILVTTTSTDGKLLDRTREARYQVLDPAIVKVDEHGRVQPRTDGSTQIEVHVDQESFVLPVTVEGFANPRAVSFRDEIVPILSKAGCNSGSCHGKKEGQNGFTLSVFGNEPDADHEEIALQSRGRRVFRSAPEQSLLIEKATAVIPHGGGRRLEPDSPWLRRLTRWISEGSRFQNEDESQVVTLEVEPKAVDLAYGASFQITVTAIGADGRQRCVTAEAEYDSNAFDIATVDHDGLITARKVPGEAGILVRHLGHVAVCRITVPQPGVKFKRPPEQNFVDTHIWNKMDRLGLQPSGLANDGMFLRRVFLDIIGTLPTAEEARAFLADTSPDKRKGIIDKLLQRDEYADYWALLWADLLRVDRHKIEFRGAVSMTRWLRRQFKENTPYDIFARRIVAARGNTYDESPAAFFQAIKKPEALGESMSQLFLGVRLECAKCHNHPSDVWRPSDYYGFAGFFSGIERKEALGGGTIIFANGGKDRKDSKGRIAPTAALGAAATDLTGHADRREVLADWLVAKENPYFARLIVNRLWAHYFGRGLVEPVDDMRETNPPTNPELLDALAVHLRERNFDLKALTRTLLNSRAYQLSSEPNETNSSDTRNYSHAQFRPMPAEVLLDAISQVTGIPEEFNGWPRGQRAIQVWDNSMPSYFFRIFGRPTRVTVCSCERGNEPSVAQALHLLNSAEVATKIGHRHGRARALANSPQSPREIIDEICLSTLSRYPSTPEREVLLEAFRAAGEDRRRAVEDVLWVLLNTKRFVFVN